MTRKAVALFLYVSLLVTAAYGTYIWGWYRGLTHHAVLSDMSGAKLALSAAKSLRQSDTALALELLESDISWMTTMLVQSANEVPPGYEGGYDIVMNRLREYHEAYGVRDGR